MQLGSDGIARPAVTLPYLSVSAERKAGRGQSCSPRVTPRLSAGSAPCPSSALVALPHVPQHSHALARIPMSIPCLMPVGTKAGVIVNE